MVLSSRSSKAVTIFSTLFDRPVGETPAVFAGVGIDNPHSGPNGVVIAGDQIWAGDYPSIVRVFSLRTGVTSPEQIATIDTGGTLRADEMDYDPADRIVAVANTDVEDAQTVPFVSLISKDTFAIIRKIYFNGSNGTADATQGGLGSVLYDSQTGKFLISVVQVGSNVTAGEVDEMDPTTGDILRRFTGINHCQPAGMAQGPGENVLIGCDPGFPAPDPVAFSPRTYVINGRTGEIVATFTQVGGEDEVWYNPGDQRYYTASRDYFTSPSATAATPVLGIIDARTNTWITNLPTGPNSHSVSANPLNNHVYVPLKNPNADCGALPGCVEVFGYSFGGWPSTH